MRCNDFDAHIDEMLSGILHPDANQHMRQCERCNTHFRARATVQNGLRKLASAAVSGPSHATDCAIMETFRRFQQHRAGAQSSASAPASDTRAPAHLFTFPVRNLAPVWASRTWWTGAAAAAVVLAVFGSAVHLWTGVPTVSAPTVATAPSVSGSAPQQDASIEASPIVASPHTVVVTNATPQRSSQPSAQRQRQPEVAAAAAYQSTPLAPVLVERAAAARPSVAYVEPSNYDSGPVTQLSANARSVVHLASAGAASNNLAQTASSTWPGYSNLMYCDPVVCSGPMQVVHIKVPVRQVKPNLGQTMGNAFVNAEVVVGPDGVARAIRVAN